MRKTVPALMCMAAAVMLVASCTKPVVEEKKETIVGGPTVFNCVAERIGIGTKSHSVSCFDVLWDKSDRIYVTDDTNNEDSFTLCDGEGTTKGTFKQDFSSDLNPSKTKISGEIQAFSPASLRVGDRYEWPAVQTADLSVPMYARQTITEAEDEFVSFSCLGAILQIVLTTSEKSLPLDGIKLYDTGKALSGEFTVDDGKAVMTSTDLSGITMNLDNVTIGGAAKYFNIAIPAGKYEDLHIEFLFGDGRVCKMVSTTLPEIMHNTVAKIALFLDITHMPTGISLNYSDLDLIPGDVYSLLKATVLPDDAENKNVIWSSSDESIVTVDPSGNVHAVALGKATVTAKAVYSGLSTSCEVRVNEYPVGALPGKFSVAEDKRVFFSKGNLWKGTWLNDYTRLSDNYYIETTQWIRQPMYDSIWKDTHIDHFFFTNDGNIAIRKYYSKETHHPQLGEIFFTNKTEDTPNPDFCIFVDGKDWKGVWRILSDSEWKYLLYERKMTYDKPRYSNWHHGVRMKGYGGQGHGWIYRGLFIYPDDFNLDPMEDYEYSWEEINELGIVVLIVGGIRVKTDVKNLSDYGETNPAIGWYWASNPNAEDILKANSLRFETVMSPDKITAIPSEGIRFDAETDRGIGHNVRLVRDVLE